MKIQEAQKALAGTQKHGIVKGNNYDFKSKKVHIVDWLHTVIIEIEDVEVVYEYKKGVPLGNKLVQVEQNLIRLGKDEAFRWLNQYETLNRVALPERVFNSPLMHYANFQDGTFVNLIRLIKPYANGDSYAIYETTNSSACFSGLFKTRKDAESKFDFMVSGEKKVNPIRSSSILF